VGTVLAVLWIFILLMWKTASIGSLVAMGLLVPLVTVSGASYAAIAWASGIAAFVVVRHATNIRDLAASSERRMTG
jgi:glycerol-3-phosphate acyltransferase PlsY